MVGLKLKDINKDAIMMFLLSFEYPMSFTNLLKLYNISKRYFWTFMEICGPMLKMGVRKAAMIRKTAEKLLPYYTNEGEKEELTSREEYIKEMFEWFVQDNFTDGDGCLHISQFESIPAPKGYTKAGMCVATDYPRILKNLDQIDYIQIGEAKFHKTSKSMFYMEKFCGDLDIYQIDNLSLKDMLRKIYEGERKMELEAIDEENAKKVCKG